MNNFIIIGRLCNDIEIQERGEGRRVVSLCLACNREFKNMEGLYDTDFLYVSLWEFQAELAYQSLKKGAMVGVKGRILPKKVKLADGPEITVCDLIGEKLIYLGSNKNSESQEDIEG